MLWFTLGLLFLGLLLIYLEFFLPGGIPASIGALILIGSAVFFYNEFHHSGWLVGYVMLTVGLIIATCYFALRQIERSGKDNSMFLKSDQKGYSASSYEKELIGKSGTTITPLRLSGHIEVEGERYQALSHNQYIAAKMPVTVVGGRGGYLIVKESE